METHSAAPVAVQSDTSLTEEAILGVEDTGQEPTESLQELKDQSDENYFESLRNNFVLEQVSEHPDEESESLGPDMHVLEESDSDQEENPSDSDSESQQSREEPAGSRREREQRRPASTPSAADSSIMPKPSVIIDEGRKRVKSGAVESSQKKEQEERRPEQ